MRKADSLATTPVQQAITIFGDEFFDVVAWYMDNGFVYCDKDTFVLASEQNRAILLGNKKPNNVDKNDCWYIQYVAGNLKRVFDVCPHSLEWIAFERHGKSRMKCYKFCDLKQKLGN